jgi:hypothetical protein
LSEADLARECGPAARSVSVWARFAQPARLVWTSGEEAAGHVVRAVAQAAPTLFQFTLPLMEPHSEPVEIWKRGFALTYGAELRAERTDRSSKIVDADPKRYEKVGRAVLEALASKRRVDVSASPGEMARRWRRMQRKGKLLSVLRLMKASGTFAGGIDYIAWKINRHAGTDIRITPWQRRWPLLGAITLLPLLLRRGAIR